VLAETFLQDIVAVWEKIIPRCRSAKFRQFSKSADRAWAFLGNTYEELYIDARDANGEKFPYAESATWKTRRNLSREYVAVMLPYIHAKLPNRLVLPRRPGLPPELVTMAQSQLPEIGAQIAEAMAVQRAIQPVDAIQAFLQKWWLNYLPSEYNLYAEQRRALPEALVKGRCLAWTEMEQGPYGLIPVTTYDTVDGLLCDPDARSWKRQGYIIRQRCESVIETARTFNLPKEELRGKHQSNWSASQVSTTKTGNEGADLRPTEKDGDICVYYEFFSRIGIGNQLADSPEELKPLEMALSALGDNVYLAIMPGVPYPLNLPPAQLGLNPEISNIKRRIAWPIPFHADRITDPWPCSALDFMPNSNDPWATSPLEGCLPMLAWLDHAYSYLMTRVKASCRNLFLASKALKESLVHNLMHGLDLEVLWYNGEPGVEFDKLFKRFEFPEFKRDLLILIGKIEEAFRMGSGMDAALYGAQPQAVDRSATATRARESRLSSRPNDFADCVENWNSQIGAKECLATRLYVGKDVIAPFFGETDRTVPDPNIDPETLAYAQESGQEVPTVTIPGPLTQLWQQLVQVGSEDMSEEELIDAAAKASAQFSITVEAGSGRRRNQQKQAEDFNSLSQILLPTFIQLAQTGNPGPYNAMMALASDVFERSMDSFMLGQEGMAQAQQPDPEQEAELERQRQEQDNESQAASSEESRRQQEMMSESERHQQEMRHREEAHSQEMRMKRAQGKSRGRGDGRRR